MSDAFPANLVCNKIHMVSSSFVDCFSIYKVIVSHILIHGYLSFKPVASVADLGCVPMKGQCFDLKIFLTLE
jgi:hypothetical protein